MATKTGLYDISKLLATRFQSAAEFGLDTIQAVLAADVAAHNALVNDMVAGLCEITSERQRRYGTSVDGEMIEVDEYGRAPTQAPVSGATVGFPLRLFQYAVGWTRKWFETHTPADMAQAVQAAEKAHLRRIQYEIKRALFLSSNYTFQDFLVDKVDLAVKRLINADGTSIPDGPNGETFDGSSHTHYDAIDGITATALTNLINDVVEHGHGGAVKVAINRGNETTVRGLNGFEAYPDPRMVYRATDAPGMTLDISRLDNRSIGIFGAAEVWVKPWCPASYAFAWDAADPRKPLAFRQRDVESLQGLRIAAQLDDYPLQAEYMEAEFGVGVWERTNGAVLYFGDGSYADPTLSM
jgi:hypothetical protein